MPATWTWDEAQTPKTWEWEEPSAFEPPQTPEFRRISLGRSPVPIGEETPITPAMQQAVNIWLQKHDPRWNVEQPSPSIGRLIGQGMELLNRIPTPQEPMPAPLTPIVAPPAIEESPEEIARRELKQRVYEAQHPISTGVGRTAEKLAVTMAQPSGPLALAATPLAPQVMLPIWSVLGTEGSLDALERIQRARETGDRAAYYEAVSDLGVNAPMALAPLLPRSRAATIEQPRIDVETVPAPVQPLRPFLPPRVQPGERAGIPPIEPRQPPVVPGTAAQTRETVIETIRKADARTLAQIQALFPEAKLTREQARVFRNIAFPPVPEPVRPQATVAEVLGQRPPEPPPEPGGAPVPKQPPGPIGGPKVEKPVDQMTQEEYATFLSQNPSASESRGTAGFYNELIKKPEWRGQRPPKLSPEDQREIYSVRIPEIANILKTDPNEPWISVSIGDSRTKNPDGSRSKLYITLSDWKNDWTAENIGRFVDRLSELRFNGSVKTIGAAPFTSDRLVYQFDNIVAHAKSDADVQIANQAANEVWPNARTQTGLDAAGTSYTDLMAKSVANAVGDRKPIQLPRKQFEQPTTGGPSAVPITSTTSEVRGLPTQPGINEGPLPTQEGVAGVPQREQAPRPAAGIREGVEGKQAAQVPLTDPAGNTAEFYSLPRLRALDRSKDPRLAAAKKYYGAKTVPDLARLAKARFDEMAAKAAPMETREDAEMKRVQALPEGPEGEAQLAAEDIANAVNAIDVSDVAGYSPVPALVRLIRRAARDPAMKTAAEQAMQKIGDAARAQGVPLDTIKNEIAGELKAIYGADAAEMATHYFGESPKIQLVGQLKGRQTDAGVLEQYREFFGENPLGSTVKFQWPEGGTATGKVTGHAREGALRLEVRGQDYPVFVRERQLIRTPESPAKPAPLTPEEQAAAQRQLEEEVPAAQPEALAQDAVSEWQQTARGRDVYKADIALENAKDEAVISAMKSAPSYPQLLAAYNRFRRSLYGKSYDPSVIEKTPWEMLDASSGVMNANSVTAKTLARLENAVFAETGLPRQKPSGRFRGGTGVDWDRVTAKVPAARAEEAPAPEPTKPPEPAKVLVKQTLENGAEYEFYILGSGDEYAVFTKSGPITGVMSLEKARQELADLIRPASGKGKIEFFDPEIERLAKGSMTKSGRLAPTDYGLGEEAILEAGGVKEAIDIAAERLRQQAIQERASDVYDWNTQSRRWGQVWTEVKQDPITRLWRVIGGLEGNLKGLDVATFNGEDAARSYARDFREGKNFAIQNGLRWVRMVESANAARPFPAHDAGLISVRGRSEGTTPEGKRIGIDELRTQYEPAKEAAPAAPEPTADQLRMSKAYIKNLNYERRQLLIEELGLRPNASEKLLIRKFAERDAARQAAKPPEPPRTIPPGPGAASPETPALPPPGPPEPPREFGMAAGGGFGGRRFGLDMANLWQDIKALWQRRPIKRDMAQLADAMIDTIPANKGREAANDLRVLTKERTGGKLVDNALARKAAVFVIQAKGDRAKLAADLSKVAGNKEAEASINYAQANWDALQPLANRTKSLLDAQIVYERANGIDTEYENHYVPQRHENIVTDRGVLFGETSGGPGSTGFKKAKVFPDYASAIEAGYIPRNLDIADLVEHRVRTGQRLVNRKLWADGLRTINDPYSGEPIVADMIQRRIPRPDGTTDIQYTAPQGYAVKEIIPGVRIAVRQGYSHLFDALTGTSQIRESPVGRGALAASGWLKHQLLLLDSFHASRTMQTSLAARGSTSYGKGLSLLELSDRALTDAVNHNLITSEMASWIRTPQPFEVGGKTVHMTPREVAQLGQRNGLNVGRFADALYNDAKGIVGTNRFSRWLFEKLTRGAMVETFLSEFGRVAKNNPTMDATAVSRKVARDINVMFGNLQRQSVIKNPAIRDLMQIAFLAPQWVESLARRELRAVGQTAQAGFGVATGKGLKVGTVAKTVGTGLAAYVAITQLINFLSRGHSTLQNEEDEHKLDAYIPDPTGQSDGFWFSPLSVFGEITHDFIRYSHTEPTAADVPQRIAENKLGPVGRSLKVMATGEDPFGTKLPTTWDRAKEAGLQLVPLPIGVQPLMQAAGKELGVEGMREPRPGAVVRQAAGSLGFKIEPYREGEAQMKRAREINTYIDYWIRQARQLAPENRQEYLFNQMREVGLSPQEIRKVKREIGESGVLKYR